MCQMNMELLPIFYLIVIIIHILSILLCILNKFSISVFFKGKANTKIKKCVLFTPFLDIGSVKRVKIF